MLSGKEERMRINEKTCLSEKLNGAIAIRALKQFVAERDAGGWKRLSKKLPSTGKKVAIVGSGPTGLTAGYYLAKQGHSVTIFEALSKSGGMMRFGIPDYRLSKDILNIEIKEIEDEGIDIRLNTRITSIDWLFSQGYDAAFLAIGAQRGLKPPISTRPGSGGWPVEAAKATNPSTLEGDVAPWPVAKIMMAFPRTAGCVAEFTE